MIDSYDPNIRWATHTVEVTLMQWEYRFVTTFEMAGNCRGLTILGNAESEVFEKLRHAQDATREPGDDRDYVQIIMTKPGTETSDDPDELEIFANEREIENMIVSVKIVGHVEEEERFDT